MLMSKKSMMRELKKTCGWDIDGRTEEDEFGGLLIYNVQISIFLLKVSTKGGGVVSLILTP